MLIGESRGFDLQELWLTLQTVDKDAQSMCGQFGVKPGTQAPEGMRMIDFNQLFDFCHLALAPDTRRSIEPAEGAWQKSGDDQPHRHDEDSEDHPYGSGF